MPEPVRRVLEQVAGLWAALSRAQRLALAGTAAAAAAVLLGLTLWAYRPDLTTLYANLTPADAGLIVEQLKAAQVPYRVADNGTRILVPAGAVHETRIKLAAAGLPQGGGVGFELFDRATFGTTDFVQKLNYQRALQGELARTISQIREVVQARVHIALPQPTVFSDRERPPTASVVLTLRPGARLAPEQVRAIVHLVSASVEGLAADHVTVVDSAGRILSQRAERAQGAGTAAGQLEYQLGVEAELQRRVQGMLEEVLGPGRASVRVAAQVEFSHGERTEERVDPNTVVRSEQRTSEAVKGSSTRPAGVPGTASNVGAPPPAVPGTTASNETLKEQESVQYEVGRVVERRTLVAGEIKRLTVAVLLDPRTAAAPAPGGGERRVPAPRDPAELEKLRAMVMKAVGFNAARGDEVEVAEVPFDTSAVERERAAAERAERVELYWSLGKGAAALAAVLVFLLAVVRPLLAARRRGPVEPAAPLGPRLARSAGRSPAVDEAAVAGQVEAALSGALPAGQLLEVRKREELQARVQALARKDPNQVAQLIRSWIAPRGR